MYNMQSLEKALATNPRDLLHFAATKEFTGENIIFLTQVRDWKESWAVAGGEIGVMTMDTKRKLYNNAAAIFFNTVCLQTAQFPINIEGKIYSVLEHLFQSKNIPAPKVSATPFADDATGFELPEWSQQLSRLPSSTGHSLRDEEAAPMGYPFNINSNIPVGFDGTVFDRAEASVKYMVLTNTWVKYVVMNFSTHQSPST